MVCDLSNPFMTMVIRERTAVRHYQIIFPITYIWIVVVGVSPARNDKKNPFLFPVENQETNCATIISNFFLALFRAIELRAAIRFAE